MGNRFIDNGNGTVTDNLTGLIWLKNANAFGERTWARALLDANTLSSGTAGLTDGSKAGDWRLPNVKELHSLIDFEYSNPALPDTSGTGRWSEGNPFINLRLGYYWSSTTDINDPTYAWYVYLGNGRVYFDNKTVKIYVWPVRAE